MLELLLVITAVLITSATCSLFEAVLYSVPASRIEALERAGRPAGHILKELRRQVDRPIAAATRLTISKNEIASAPAISYDCPIDKSRSAALIIA